MSSYQGDHWEIRGNHFNGAVTFSFSGDLTEQQLVMMATSRSSDISPIQRVHAAKHLLEDFPNRRDEGLTGLRLTLEDSRASADPLLVVYEFWNMRKMLLRQPMPAEKFEVDPKPFKLMERLLCCPDLTLLHRLHVARDLENSLRFLADERDRRQYTYLCYLSLATVSLAFNAEFPYRQLAVHYLVEKRLGPVDSVAHVLWEHLLSCPTQETRSETLTLYKQLGSDICEQVISALSRRKGMFRKMVLDNPFPAPGDRDKEELIDGWPR
ncbi:hypothetical protein ACH41E_30135 [Streptomyces sp. NPDC020412]|uniref:hypothetical protein n=1 Tax=Streptomyces sp. NPDC020412 TaxID=3365073 RepID=UPI0037B39214